MVQIFFKRRYHDFKLEKRLSIVIALYTTNCENLVFVVHYSAFLILPRFLYPSRDR